jgi:hypothetical protein
MITQPKRTKKSASQAPLARSPGCQLRGDPTIDRTGSPGGSQPFTQHSSGFPESSCRSSQRGCGLRARLARHRDRARGPNVHTADFRTLSRASRGPSQRLPGRADLDRVRIGLGLRGSQPGEWIRPVLAVALAALATAPTTPLLDAYALRGLALRGRAYGPVRLWGSVAFVFGNFGAGYVIDRIAPIQIIWLLFGSLVIVAAVSLTLQPIAPDGRSAEKSTR